MKAHRSATLAVGRLPPYRICQGIDPALYGLEHLGAKLVFHFPFDEHELRCLYFQ
ncbi:MAG: hypothetical protein ABSH28_11995 [Acidobacteriota bacterium]